MVAKDKAAHAELVKKRRQELREMGFRSAEIWLPQEQLKAIDDLARSERVNRSKMVEELITDALRHRQQSGQS